MRLFISYAHVDKPKIDELVEILRSGGYEPWFDHALIVGMDWQQQLYDAVQQCDGFVYAMTPTSIVSEWCLWELKQAVDMGKSIIPVLVEPVDQLPEFIDHKQYADFTQGATAIPVAKLMRGLQHIERTLLPDVPQRPAGVPSNVANLDELIYERAVQLAKAEGSMSISLLQTRLKVGYHRAKRVLAAMEAQGIIGAYPGGSKRRPLLIDPDED